MATKKRKTPATVRSKKADAEESKSAAPAVDPFEQFTESLEQIRKHGHALEKYSEVVHKHERAILLRLLDLLKPIVKYVDEEITIREAWMAGSLGGAKDLHYPERGIVLVNNFSSQADPEDPHVVQFTGYKVILTRSGRLVQVSRTGVWRKSGGDDSFWSIDSLEVPVTPEFARDHLHEIVQSIVRCVADARDRVSGRKREMESRLVLIKNVKQMLDDGTLGQRVTTRESAEKAVLEAPPEIPAAKEADGEAEADPETKVRDRVEIGAEVEELVDSESEEVETETEEAS